MKRWARALLRRLFTDYRINWIYAARAPGRLPLLPGEQLIPTDAATRAALAESPTYKMRNTLSFARAGLAGLVIMRGGDPLCVAHFATPEQYDCAQTWPLREGELALVDIATEETARGQGLAPRMIAAASRQFLGSGTRRLIAMVWWSNTPSRRAFAKAGWQRIGFSLEWQAGDRWRALRLALPGAAG